MNRTVKIQLSTMMFLQFFIWGGWFVTLGTFLANSLQASGQEIGMAFSTQSWGAIIAPFIIGLIADRYFNAERILGVLHLVGAALMVGMYGADSFVLFYPMVFAYMVLYMPTLALVNSVSFNQMEDSSKEFAKVRVWGTIGWIVAGLMISYLFAWDSKAGLAEGALRYTFLLSAVASALLGILSFTLPKTPPTDRTGEKPSLGQILGLDALGLLKERNFAVFFVCAILICIPLAFYYQNTNLFLTGVGMENATAKMTIGQMSEVLFMLALPLLLVRFGIKATLLLAMLAWVLRYVLFAYGNAGDLTFMLLLGIALHGICYDFFFVAGQIYTDKKAAGHYRSAAQGMLTLATYGVGMLIGFYIAGLAIDLFSAADGSYDWNKIWLLPAGLPGVVLVIFLALFKPEKISNPDV